MTHLNHGFDASKSLGLPGQWSAVGDHPLALIERGLRPPVQTGEIRVFTLLSGQTIALVGLALHALLLFFPLFLLAHFLALAFCDGNFGSSSDDALLGMWRTCVHGGVLWGGAASPFSG
jgi:hypothetical protein